MAANPIRRRPNLHARLLTSAALPASLLVFAAPAAAQTGPTPDQPLTVNAGQVVDVPASVRVTGLSGGNGTVDIKSGATLTVDQSGTTTYAGALIGNGPSFSDYFVKNGIGTLTLSGSGTRSQLQVFRVNAGTVQLLGGQALGDTDILAVNGGTVRLLSSETVGALSGTAGGTIDLGANTLTIGPSVAGNYVNAANVTGTGVLHFVAAGLQTTLAGTQSLSGLYQISAGDLSIAADTAFNPAADLLIDGGRLTLNAANTVALDNVTLNGGAIRGAGTLRVLGAYAQSDGVIGAGSVVDVQSGDTTLTGGLIQGTIVGRRPSPIDDPNIFATFINGRTTTVTGALTLSHGIEVGATGSGTLIASGGGQVSSTSGLVARLAGSTGTVQVLGASRWSLGRDLQLGLAGTGNLTISNGGVVEVPSLFAGSGNGGQANITVTGTGSQLIASSLMILGVNGGVNLTLANGGRVQAGILNAANFGPGSATINFGAAVGAAAAAPGTLAASSITFGGGTGRLNFNHTASDLAFSTNVSGAADIRQIAGTTRMTGNLGLASGGSVSVEGGILELTGVNSFLNPLAVSGGTLVLGNDRAAGGATGRIVTTGSTIALAAGVTNAAQIAIASNSTKIEVATGTAVQSGVISETGGPRPLEKTGNGTLVLTGVNSFTGTTLISGGTLQIGNGGTAGSIGGGAIVNNAGLVFNRSDDITATNPITGNGALTKLGAGTLTLTGASGRGGDTIVSQGTLAVTTAGALGTGPVRLSGAGTRLIADFDGTVAGLVSFLPGSNTTFAAATGRTVSLGRLSFADAPTARLGSASHQGTVILDLTEATATGPAQTLAIDGGTVRLAGASNLFDTVFGNAALTSIAAGATLDTNGRSFTLRGLGGAGTLANSGTGSAITLLAPTGFSGTIDTGAGGMALAGTLNGVTGFTKTGGGILNLDAGLTAGGYSGTTSIASGLVQLNASNALGSGTIALSGGGLRGGAEIALANDLDVAAGTESRVQAATGTTLQLNGALTQRRDSVVRFGTATDNGIVALNFDTWSVSDPISASIDGGTLRLDNRLSADFVSGIGGTAGGAFNVDGLLDLNGFSVRLNQLTGSGRISGGAGPVTIETRSLGVGTVFSGVIADGAGALGLDHRGGTLTLSGANSFTGPTTVTNGTLLVTGAINSAITVGGSGTLGGMGSFGGAVVVNAGGILSPGLSPGQMVLPELTLNAGSTTLFDLGAPGGSANDLISVSGTLRLNGGTIAVNPGSGFDIGRYTLFRFGTLEGAVGNLSLAGLGGSFAGGLAVGNGDVQLTVASATDSIWWNGSTTVPTGAIVGGSGTWSLAGRNFTNIAGTIAAPWAGNGSMAVFAGTGGTVIIAPDTVLSVSGLEFRSDGYTIAGGNAGSGLRFDNAMGISTDTGVGAVITANLSGAGSLTKAGGGTLTLSGANTYGGGTTLLEGTLRLGRDGVLASTSGLSVLGGTLDLDGTTTDVNSISLSSGTISGGTLRVDGTGTGYRQSGGILSADADVTMVNAASIHLSGGTVAGRLSGSDALVDAGSVRVTGVVGLLGRLAVGQSGPATLDILIGGAASAGFIDIGGGTGGSAFVRVSGTASILTSAGELAIAGANGSDGTLTVADNATVQATKIRIAGGAGSVGTLLVGAMPGSAPVAAGQVDAAQIDFGPGNGQLIFNHSDPNHVLGSDITGSGLIRHLAGTTLLSGDIDLVGGVDVAGGQLAFTGAVAIGGRISVAGESGIAFDTSAASIGSLDGAGTVALRSGALTLGGDNGSTNYSGVISGAGALIKTGNGTLTLTAANGYTGLTTINAGTIQLASGASLAGAVDNRGQFVNRGVVAGLVSNSGTLQSDGQLSGGLVNRVGGDAILAGTVGSTITNAGLIRLSGDLAGGAMLDQADGAEFDATQRTLVLGHLSGGGIVTLTGASLTIAQSAADTLFTGSLRGNGGQIVKEGAARLTLGGINSFSGTTLIDGGELAIAAGGSLAGDVVNAAGFANAGQLGGVLLNRGTATNSGTVLGGVQNDAVLVSTGIIGTGLMNRATARLQGQVSGIIDNTGSVTLTGVLAGVDQFVQSAGGALDLAGYFLSLGGLSGGGTIALGAGSLTVGGNDRDSTFAGVMSGTGGLIKRGSGVLALTGVNSFTGTTSVASGTLMLTETGGLAGSADIHSGSTFANAGRVSGSVTNAGTVSSSGAIVGTFTNRGIASLSGTVGGDLLHESGRVSLSSNLTVSGRLVQGDAAVLDLAGAAIQVGSLSGSGAISMAGGLLIAGDDNSSTSFAGTLSGPGDLVKLGTGTLTLTGISGGTGTAFVEAGGLTIGVAGNPASSAQIAGTLVNRAVVTNHGTVLGNLGNAAGASIDNRGVIAGVTVNEGSLTSTGTLAGGLVNRGTARIAGVVTGDVGNSGDILVAGTTTGIASFDQGAAGRLDLAGFNLRLGILSGAGAITLGSGTLTTGTDGVESRFAGVISGSGELISTGIGRLILTGANGYTGGTRIDGAVLQLGDGGAGGSIIGPVINDGTFVIARSDAFRFGGAISGSGLLIQNGSGTTTLTGTNSYSGGTWVAAGRLAGDTAALQGTIRNDAILEFAMAGDGMFGGTLFGAGRIEKTGPGILTFGGDGSMLTGPMDVFGGGLHLAGRLDRSLVTLASGTRLSGNGVIGGLVVNGGAEVSPGASIGAIGVSGDVRFLAGSRYVAEVSDTAGADRILASGTATLAGSLIVTNIGAASYAFNSRYALIGAEGGISGAFDTVSFTGFNRIYQPKLVTTVGGLEVMLAPASISGLAGTGLSANQAAVAARLDMAVSGGLNPQAFFDIYALEAPQLAAALDQLSGEIHPAMGRASMRQGRLLREAVLDRAAEIRPGAMSSGFGGWGKLMRSWGDVDAQGSAAGQRSEMDGFILGLEGGGSNEIRAFRVGVYGGVSTARVTIQGRGSSGRLKQAGGGVYASLALGGLSLTAGGGAARLDVNTERSPAIDGLSDTLVGQARGDLAQAFGRIGYRLAVADAVIEPFVIGDYADISINPVAEAGGPVAIVAQRQQYRVGGTSVGLASQGPLGPFWLETEVAARFELGDRVPQAMIGLGLMPDQASPIAGTRLSQTAARTRVNLELPLAKGVRTAINYSAELSSADVEHAALVGLNIAF